MSVEEVPPLHGEVVRLLAACRGRGAVVVARPAGDPAGHHHFYAGVARAPALSFLEALLLALGGDLEDGSRRYEEIVVVTAGRAANEGGRDKPAEEIVRYQTASGSVERGNNWGAWWYREPSHASPPAAAAGAGDRPDPLGGEQREQRLRRWSTVAGGQQTARPQTGGEFSQQIDATESADHYPNRWEQLSKIVETLEGRPHRALLVVELAVLDYASPDVAPVDHNRITDVGAGKMDWFASWIDGRSGLERNLDLLLYSRNPARVEALLSSGLPRRPPGYTGPWHAVSYQGRNAVRIDYPCGRFPWGGDLFEGDEGFQPMDGTRGDSQDGRKRYPNRTLGALLSGRGAGDRVTRFKFATARPTPPPRPAASRWIDREFWSRVDLPLVRQALRREYYGADDSTALQTLFAAIDFMQQQARRITNAEAFHRTVELRWRKASALLLWGDGGLGKSFVGEKLARLIFGGEYLLFPCESAVSGGHGDQPIGFAAQFFGSPPGYVGSGDLTAAGQHLVNTAGFTVVVLDEVNKIAPNDFGASLEVLYGLVHDRLYHPANPALTNNRPVSLWNTIFVLTANLDSFPPPGLPAVKREAITRRFSDHQLKLFDHEAAVAFAQWHLPLALEEAFGGVAVCTCDDITAEIERLRLQEKSPAKLGLELAPRVDAARDELARAGVTPDTCPPILDVTDVLRRVLRR